MPTLALLLQMPPALPLFMPGQAAEVIEAAIFGLVVIIASWPLMRAFAKRIEGKGGADPALRAEVEDLRHRLADVEATQPRIAELEDRLDFAERLLAHQQQENARLGAGPKE